LTRINHWRLNVELAGQNLCQSQRNYRIHDISRFHRLRHLQISGWLKQGNGALSYNRGEAMTSTERLICGSITTTFPPLRQPKPETVDRGTVRLGDACITAAFPPLRQPKPETVDRGTVRLGDACITAAFPPLRQPKPETVDRGRVRLGDACITAAFPPYR
jgi:hypothetical protein